jgi:hypothetical protein
MILLLMDDDNYVGLPRTMKDMAPDLVDRDIESSSWRLSLLKKQQTPPSTLLNPPPTCSPLPHSPPVAGDPQIPHPQQKTYPRPVPAVQTRSQLSFAVGAIYCIGPHSASFVQPRQSLRRGSRTRSTPVRSSTTDTTASPAPRAVVIPSSSAPGPARCNSNPKRGLVVRGGSRRISSISSSRLSRSRSSTGRDSSRRSNSSSPMEVPPTRYKESSSSKQTQDRLGDYTTHQKVGDHSSSRSRSSRVMLLIVVV